MRMVAWDMYFSSVVAMQLHPGNNSPDRRLSLLQCAAMADAMMFHRSIREKCNGYVDGFDKASGSFGEASGGRFGVDSSSAEGGSGDGGKAGFVAGEVSTVRVT